MLLHAGARATPRWSGICWRELHAGARATPRWSGICRRELHAGAGSVGGNSTLEPRNSTLWRDLPAGTPRCSRGTPRCSGICRRELHAGAAELHAVAGSVGGNSTLEPRHSTLERDLLARPLFHSKPYCRCGRSACLRLTACGKTHAAFGRRCIPPEPLRFAPFFVAFRSKYTRYSSLTRLVGRAPHQARRSRGFHHRLLTDRPRVPPAPRRLPPPEHRDEERVGPDEDLPQRPLVETTG